ncbi:MAG: CDP-glycerol glycerophosphotransferase family protein [Candidatus Cloacimonetes bacterium]|nr:CDP-glycerol glycerophosphotransferase family protein [Candidatus Cloacimonadota bacterium]MDY0173369.1 CDP-glycerol glycerophosphotransferase family protein [Candidatus Cloacimonadaceae bacterium]
MYLILIIILFLAPGAAYGYLDPGSGAVLINLIIAGLAALLYSLKGLFLRIFGKDIPQEGPAPEAQIALFSEGQAYSQTFQPLIQALIQRKEHFAYYTLDIDDTMLQIDSPYCHSRFLGHGALGKYRAGTLREPILLSTTPNIGCKGYPVKRSAKTRNLVHVFHSLVDISMYRKGSLDHYDTVIMPGEYQKAPIREIEQKRKLKAKQMISLGAPYLDILLAEKQQNPHSKNDNCILVAASWGDKGLLKQYGIEAIIDLAQKGFQLIIRPHPYSLKHEPELIQKLQKQSAGQQNIKWDFQLSPTKSMQEAAILISDTSSIRFDFAFIYEKPVLTLEILQEAMPGFEGEYVSRIWSDSAALEIGQIVPQAQAQQDLAIYVQDTLKDYDAQRIRRFRDASVTNFGTASAAIADYLATIPTAPANKNKAKVE